MKTLTLSLIIPAFNEEQNLAGCLDSVARQTVMPDEVIVVDNNSTDNTAAIAKRYPFVKLLREPRQGLIPARNRGFNAARGDILGRINANAQLGTTWVERALADFADPKVAGLTGLAKTELVGSSYRQSTWWSRLYFLWCDVDFGIPIMWGANMAIRRSAWLDTQALACLDDRFVHEDQDLSILLVAQGGQIRRDNRLLIELPGASYHGWPRFWEYTRRRYRTMSRHRRQGTLSSARQHNGSSLVRRLLIAIGLILPGIFYIGSSLLFAVPLLLKRRSAD